MEMEIEEILFWLNVANEVLEEEANLLRKEIEENQELP